jgi:hypothetical protein
VNRARPLVPAIAYVALTVAMTWPLAAGLARDVPADLGDSLLNLWILGWASERLLDVLAGAGSWAAFWHGNIFHPEPLTLTFSEHLVGLAVQTLPVYVATGNLILCYNLLFLASFVVSGLGTYLLVHRLTGHRGAAFVAGLFYAFAPYRVGQFPHIQVVQSQWMPLALYGFRVFFEKSTTAAGSGVSRWVALAGGTAALVLQNLSCGYYLMFFAPIVPAYVIYEIADRRLWRDARVWAGLAAAGIATAACTWPFLAPYLEARRVFGFTRPLGEVTGFSADVLTYLTAADGLRVWGPRLRLHPQPEGGLFPGAVPLLFAALALGGAAVERWKGAAVPAAADTRPRSWLTRLLVALLAVHAVSLVFLLGTGGFVWEVAGLPLRMTNAGRVLTNLGVIAVALVATSPRARAWARGVPGSLVGFAALALAFCLVMSLGPLPETGDTPLIGLGLYGWFRDAVPGYDGVRVPARFAMLVALFLAILAGEGLRRVAARGPLGRVVLAAAAGLFLAEAWFAPMPVNQVWGSALLQTPPPRVPATAGEANPIYSYVAGMPAETVLAEFPFGDAAWDLRYVYNTTFHWKRILNGYSGHFPASYMKHVARLGNALAAPDAAWDAVRASGATHVLVHEYAFLGNEGRLYSDWAQRHGGRLLLGTVEGDMLFEVPRGTKAPGVP